MGDSFVLVVSVIAALAVGVGIGATLWWLSARGRRGDSAEAAGKPVRAARTPLVLLAVAVGLLASVGVLYSVSDRVPDSPASSSRASTAAVSATPAVNALAASLNLGTPSGAMGAASNAAATTPKGGDLDVMADRLAKRLKERTPDDFESWSLLARSYVELGRDADAIAAYERTGPLLKSDPKLKAELDAVKLRVSLPVQPGTAATVAATSSAPVLSGRLDVSPALKMKLPASGFVFIIARAEGQTGAPLAAKRLPMTALPMNFVLTDADSMLPGQKLSAAKTIVLSARLSESGDASPTSGAFESIRETVVAGRKDIAMVLSSRRE